MVEPTGFSMNWKVSPAPWLVLVSMGLSNTAHGGECTLAMWVIAKEGSELHWPDLAWSEGGGLETRQLRSFAPRVTKGQCMAEPWDLRRSPFYYGPSFEEPCFSYLGPRCPDRACHPGHVCECRCLKDRPLDPPSANAIADAVDPRFGRHFRALRTDLKTLTARIEAAWIERLSHLERHMAALRIENDALRRRLVRLESSERKRERRASVP